MMSTHSYLTIGFVNSVYLKLVMLNFLIARNIPDIWSEPFSKYDPKYSTEI